MVLTTALILLMALVGILLNAYVLRHLHKFARMEPNRFEHGCGLPLLVMAIADMLTLVGVVVFGVLGHVVIDGLLNDNTDMHNVLCKSMVYWTYVTTNVSMWCWVLMSAMRYLAVYHPLLELRLWHLPRRGAQLIILLSVLFNISFIGTVEYREEQCQDTAMFGWQTASWWLNLSEICWGFFIPVLCTLFMDGRVLLADPPAVLVRRHVHVGATQPLNAVHLLDSDNANASKSIESHRRTPRLRQTIFKWLTITSVDLMLNAPNNLLRLAILFADEGQPVWEWYSPVRFVSQLCYFGQFGINAIYLSLVVYKRSIKPKRSTTTTTTITLSMVPQSLLIVSSPVSTAGNLTSSGSLQQLQSTPVGQSEVDEDNQPNCRTVRTYTM